MLRFDLILGISCHLVQSFGKPHSSRSIGSEWGICKNKNTGNRQTTSKHNKTKQQILSPLYATSLHPHSRLSRKNVAAISVDSWIIYIHTCYVMHAVTWFWSHYSDVMMSAMVSQTTTVSIVCPTVGSGSEQRKHQSSASLAFVWGIHGRPVNSSNRRPVTRKVFPFDDVIVDYMFIAYYHFPGAATAMRSSPFVFR